MKINFTEDRIPYEETKVLRTFINQADAWDRPLVQEAMLELCSRAGIDADDYEDWDSVEEEIDKRLGTMKEIIYYWYDHLLLRETGEADIVKKAIDEHDFDTFMRVKEKYDKNEQGWCYFPDFAAVYDGSNRLGGIDITTPENFAKITYSEYECG